MSWGNRFSNTRGQDAKIGNTRSVCALGHSHRSKLESSVCQILQLREKAGEILLLQVEDHITICGPKDHDCPKRKTYVADFRCLYTEGRELFWVESKGFANDRWPTTKTLWRHYGPGKLEIFGGRWQDPKLLEILEGGCA